MLLSRLQRPGSLPRLGKVAASETRLRRRYASWTSAPARGGSHPTSRRRTYPMQRTTMPAITLSADDTLRVRRAIPLASAESCQSRIRPCDDVRAASEAAAAPRAPSATPTSARRKAGASLIPSPIVMTGPPRRSVRTTSSLPFGTHTADASDRVRVSARRSRRSRRGRRSRAQCVRCPDGGDVSIALCASGLSASINTEVPAGRPPIATATCVLPASASGTGRLASLTCLATKSDGPAPPDDRQHSR